MSYFAAELPSKYGAFKHSLKADYRSVWLEITAGWIVILVALAGVDAAVKGKEFSAYSIVVGLAGGLVVGYATHFLQNFFHEAAHYGLAADRCMNDRLANFFLGLLIGQDIRQYRPVHFAHHRHLGETSDTETSYFNALDFKFVVEGLSGVQVLRVLLRRKRMEGEDPAEKVSRSQLFLGLALHATVLVFCLLTARLAVFIAWSVGMFSVFPFLASLRQLLEHRSEKADKSTDYTKVDHGEVNRLFGDGLFARTFGSAGFNRHLLHHWEPQVSCTRLKELESFFADSGKSGLLDQHRTSYWKTFLRLCGV